MKFNIKKLHIEALLEFNSNLTTDYPFLLTTVNGINKYSAAKNIKPTFDQFTKLSAFRGMENL